MDPIKQARTLRSHQTDAEKKLWGYLRDRRLDGVKFRRQHPFPPYILDFYAEEHKLAVELDGSQHGLEQNKNKDAIRTKYLNKHGIQVLRFWNNDVLTNIEGILETIYSTIKTAPSPLGRGQRS